MFITNMFSLPLVLICCIFIQVLFAATVKPGPRKGYNDWSQGGRLCNGKKVEIPESYENQVNETMKICTEKVTNLTSMLTLKKMQRIESDSSKHPFNPLKHKFLCLVICQLQELELIDDNGVFVEEEIDNFIKDAVASEEAAQIMAKFKACTEKFGNKLDISNNCENLEKNRDIVQCARAGIKEVCKLEGVGFLNSAVAATCKTE